jgi:hypothetical protein
VDKLSSNGILFGTSFWTYLALFPEIYHNLRFFYLKNERIGCSTIFLERVLLSILNPSSRILSPWLGDGAGSGIGLSSKIGWRTDTTTRCQNQLAPLADRYDNQMPKPAGPPGGPIRQSDARASSISQSGTKNWPSPLGSKILDLDHRRGSGNGNLKTWLVSRCWYDRK